LQKLFTRYLCIQFIAHVFAMHFDVSFKRCLLLPTAT
jgi:hypothetical protein